MAEKNLKELIIELLTKQHLLSVSDFLSTFKKNGRKYNKTSVYRALEQLLDDEVICRHQFSPAEALYELRDHHHAHLVCTHCGKVQTGECSYHEPKHIGSFQVNHHHTTLFGLCKECQ